MEVNELQENKDGSANLNVNLTEEESDVLFSNGLKDILIESGIECEHINDPTSQTVTIPKYLFNLVIEKKFLKIIMDKIKEEVNESNESNEVNEE